MRKPLALLAAASLSVGVFAFMGYDNSVFGKDDQKSAGTSGSSSSTSGQSSSTSDRLGSSSYSSSQSGSLPQGVTKAAQADEQRCGACPFGEIAPRR